MVTFLLIFAIICMNFGVQSLGREDPLEKGMATHSSILAWRIPWTEEPGGLQSIGSERVRHDQETNTHTHTRVLDFLHLTLKTLPCTVMYGAHVMFTLFPALHLSGIVAWPWSVPSLLPDDHAQAHRGIRGWAPPPSPGMVL